MTSTRVTTYEENHTNEDNTTQENADNDDTQQVDQDKLDKLLLNLRTISEIKDFDKLRVNNDFIINKQEEIDSNVISSFL